MRTQNDIFYLNIFACAWYIQGSELQNVGSGLHVDLIEKPGLGHTLVMVSKYIVFFNVLLMNGMVYLIILENQMVLKLLKRMFFLYSPPKLLYAGEL